MHKLNYMKKKFITFFLIFVIMFSGCTEDGVGIAIKSLSVEKELIPKEPVCFPSTEVCDGKDNDCDKEIDEGNVCVKFEEEEEKQLPRYVSGELIIKFKQNTGITTDSQASSYLQNSKVKTASTISNIKKIERLIKKDVVADTYSLNTIFLINVDLSADIPALAEYYKADPNVEYAEPNYLFYTSYIPDDPLFEYQWPLKNTEQNYYTPQKKNGGLFKFDPVQKMWVDVSTGLPDLFLSRILFDPDNTETMYIGAGVLKKEGGFGSAGDGFHPEAGIYKTTDGGNSWFRVGLENFSVMDITFTSDGVLFAATNDKIYRSFDKGLTWEHLTNFDRYSEAFSVVKSDPINPNVLYAVGDIGSNSEQFFNFYKTTNKGLTWIKKPLFSYLRNIVDIEIDHFNNNNIYAASLGYNGIYKSTDSGENWFAINEEIIDTFSGNNYIIHDLETEAIDSNVLFAGGRYGFYKTTDAGNLWERDSVFGYKRVTSIEKNGDIIYAGLSYLNDDRDIHTSCPNPIVFSEDKSIWKKEDENWSVFSQGLPYNSIISDIEENLLGDLYAVLDLSRTEELVFNQGTSGADVSAVSVWDKPSLKEPIIAILDTGIVFLHEDLRDNMLADCSNGCPEGTGYDFVDIILDNYETWCYFGLPEEDYTEEDNYPFDVHGHGTHCAGIVAASTDNSIGIAGICPDCKIMPIRTGFALDVAGSLAGTLELKDILQAVYYAADNGADVISMSFGGFEESMSIKNALNYAYDKGVLLVAAAGNNNTDLKFYPAGYENVIAVAATDAYDQKASFSNYGEWVDVAAPGKDILSLRAEGSDMYGTLGRIVNENYYVASGTSMACPYVAGLAGLLLSKNPELSKEKVKEIIVGTGDYIETDKPIGKRINAEKMFDFCGDLDRDKTISPTDVVYLINYVYKNLEDPTACYVPCGDINDDGTINPTDVVYMINWVYKKNVPECPCGNCEQPASPTTTIQGYSSIEELTKEYPELEQDLEKTEVKIIIPK